MFLSSCDTSNALVCASNACMCVLLMRACVCCNRESESDDAGGGLESMRTSERESERACDSERARDRARKSKRCDTGVD